MSRTTTTAAIAALLASTAMATAGGVERQGASTSILFEEGTYAEVGYTFIDPSVSGAQTFPSLGPTRNGSETGDIAPSYTYSNFAFRTDLTETVSMAVVLDQPIGADVDYTPARNGYLYRAGLGSQAEINSQQLTVALRYQMDENISVYGGLRAVTADGNVALFNGSGGGTLRYEMEAESDVELGYMLGAAYERPDIALRVALTYYSATDHSFTGTESSAFSRGFAVPTTFETTIPQQVHLEAQSGVAEGTLVFGSVRWVEWTAFEIRPTAFDRLTTTPNNPQGDALVDYDNDIFTYTLGGARRVTDDLTLLASVAYETPNGGFSGNLSPTDGRTSLSLGARYDMGAWRLSGGINYSWIGDAETEASRSLTRDTGGIEYSSFEDNDSFGIALRIGYQF